MKRYRNAFTTYDDVVTQLYLDASGVNASSRANEINALASDNTQRFIKQLLFDISDAIVQHTGHTFVPYVATANYYRDYIKQFCRYDYGAGAYRLETDDDLLSITSITWAGTALAANTAYRLKNPSTSPNDYILVTTAASLDFGDSVDIVGTWGYHENAVAMWRSIGTLQAGITSSATSFVATATTVTEFEIYSYLKIDDEYCFVSNVLDASPYTITIERGVNGTTAIAHDSADVIYKYQQSGAIALEARRLVIRAYQLRDAKDRVYVAAEAIRELVEVEFGLMIPTRAIFRLA